MFMFNLVEYILHSAVLIHNILCGEHCRSIGQTPMPPYSRNTLTDVISGMYRHEDHNHPASSSIYLSLPSACLTTTGHRAFSRSGPRLWNSFPHQLRNIHSFSPTSNHNLNTCLKLPFSIWCQLLSLLLLLLSFLYLFVISLQWLLCIFGCPRMPIKASSN